MNRFAWQRPVYREGEGGGGAPPAAPPAAPPPGGAAPPSVWFEGMEGLDDLTRGHIQNRGWDKLEPAKAAQEAYKAFRAAETHIGTPADRLIRLPADLSDQAGWDGVYRKLGVPETPELYDLSTLKRADGTDIPADLARVIKDAAFEAKVPKDNAAAIARNLVGHLDAQAAEQKAQEEAALTASKQKLADNWGAQFEQNMEVARRAASQFGLKPEILEDLVRGSSYDQALEFLRQVGARSMEMSFPGGSAPGANMPMTVEGAKAQMDANMRDPEWRDKYLNGSAAHRAEFERLTRIVAGVPVT